MEKLRIGIIGATGRGTLAHYWHDPDGRSEVVAAADIGESALRYFKENVNPDGYVTKDYREVLDRKDVDAVAVLSPDYTHEEFVCEAFQAGKHVFSEKPMAITTKGCDRMLRAWVDSGKQYMVGFNMRYMNIFRVMKDAVDRGDIGEVKVVWVRHFVGHGGDWYYHDWHGASRNTTGLLLQKASHDIDMIHWITGQYTKRVVGIGSLDYYGGDKPNDLRCGDCDEKDDCVERNEPPHPLRANRMDMCVYRKEIDVEDNSAMMMELVGGIKATYMQCHYSPDYWRNYVFIGTEGRLENLDDHSKVVLKTRRRSRRWRNLADHHIEVKKAHGSHGGADPEVCKDFVEMILDGKQPIATPLAGRMSVAVGYAATQSIRNGSQPADVPPVPEDIREKVF